MPASARRPTRRGFLATSAAVSAGGLLPLPFARASAASDLLSGRPSSEEMSPTSAKHDKAIRPFRVSFPETALVDLRRRVMATRWPDREAVADASQGVQLATIEKVARYWQTDHNWRKVEAKLNALPQFVTEIDGLEIHFIHVRSKHENAIAAYRHAWMA